MKAEINAGLNLPVKELKELVLTEENLKNGVEFMFVGTREKFRFVLHKNFSEDKVNMLINNLRHARHASGSPKVLVVF